MTDEPRDSDYDDEYDARAANEARDREAAKRDALLEERRARQTGNDRGGNNGKAAVVGAFLVGFAVLLVVFVGPDRMLTMLGVIKENEVQKASQVDLEVRKESDEDFRLDFLGPGQELAPADDPNADVNKRLADLQKKLDAATKARKPPEVSLSDVQKLLASFDEKMARRLEEQRKEMQAENEHLRAELARREEERRRSEEAAKQEAEAQAAAAAIDTLQRESAGVVIDESGNGGPLSLGSFANLDGNLSGDRTFLAFNARSVVETSTSEPLSDPSRTVVQGTIISAVLETAIDTELPGNIRAQVTEPVFSFDGKRILMSAGTVLIGTFNNELEVAQSRVLIAWNRAVTPNGQSIALGSTGTDVLGRAGTAGNVDNRYVKKFGAATLISAITALPTALAGGIGDSSSTNGGTTISVGGQVPASVNVGGSQGTGDQLASDMAGQVADQSKGILDKYLSLPPIIRIPQGEEIRVFVNRDLVFR